LSENGTPELLTKKQIEKLTEAKDAKKLAQSSGTQDKNASIFVTRTPIQYSQVRVNSVDGLLADEKSDIPEDLIKTINCTISASEFPAANNWKQAGFGVYTKNLCPSGYSTMKKENLKITLAPFLTSGDKAPEVFSVKVNTPGNSIKVKNIQIKIDGQLVALSNDIDSLGYAPQGQFSGRKTVLVIVKSDISEDTFEFKDIEFTPGNPNSKAAESKSASNTINITTVNP
jgi:hypothetical protein